MSKEEGTESSRSRREGNYHFFRFENDVQIVFDEISRTRDATRVGVNILKGSVHLKGDYFIPLKSADAFRLGCDELLTKLKQISCVLDVELDSNRNLTFRLKREVVYRRVLEEVTSRRERYGMFEANKSVFVLTQEEEERKSLDNLRNKLLAEHVLSILALNGCRVSYSDFKSDEKSDSRDVPCSCKCSLVGVCKDLEDEIRSCAYKMDSDDEEIRLDAKGFIEDNDLSSTYGNALTSIILPSTDMFVGLSKTCYMKHMIQTHLRYSPDVIVHITSQGQNRSTLKAGVLLSMVGGCTSRHVYIFSQSVQYKGKSSTLQNEGACSTQGECRDKELAMVDSTAQRQDKHSAGVTSCSEQYQDQYSSGVTSCSKQPEDKQSTGITNCTKQPEDKYIVGHRCKDTEATAIDSTVQRHDKSCAGLAHGPKYFRVDGSVPSQEESAVHCTSFLDQFRNSSSTAGAFIEAHRIAMETATALKYDTYDATSKAWSSRIQSLAEAAVKFDVLKQNHSSVLNLRPPSGRDGEKTFGVFVQYNHARLANLFRNFDLKVEDGTYLPLCPLEDADFGLLDLEEEWHLFSFVLSFPVLVEGVVESLVGTGDNRIRLNRVCLMLQELCSSLSLYYGRIRILGGSTPNQQKRMHVRLWMLRGILQVFRNAFRMLGIEGLDLM